MGWWQAVPKYLRTDGTVHSAAMFEDVCQHSLARRTCCWVFLNRHQSFKWGITCQNCVFYISLIMIDLEHPFRALRVILIFFKKLLFLFFFFSCRYQIFLVSQNFLLRFKFFFTFTALVCVCMCIYVHCMCAGALAEESWDPLAMELWDVMCALGNKQGPCVWALVPLTTSRPSSLCSRPSLQSLQPSLHFRFFFFFFLTERDRSLSLWLKTTSPHVFFWYLNCFISDSVVSCLHLTKSESSPNHLSPVSPGALKNESKTSVSAQAGWEDTLIHTLLPAIRD